MYSVPVRCSVSGVHSCMGTISRPAWSRQSSMVRPSFLSLGVAGSHLTWILNPWWSPVTRYRCLTYPAAHIHLEGPAAVGYSKGSCTRVLMAYSGYRAAASSLVQLFGLALGLARVWPVWGPCASAHLGGAGQRVVPVGEVRPGAAVRVRGPVQTRGVRGRLGRRAWTWGRGPPAGTLAWS